MSRAQTVEIHYHRPPGRVDVFRQRLIHRDARVVVTLMERTPLPAPMRVDGRTVLEDGSPVVWFTFPGARHDIGRFHDAAGRFTGIYANILEPVRFRDALTWDATDLFLDVWLDARGGPPRVLDSDELADALARGHVSADTAAAAEREAERLVAEAESGDWPPPVVETWTLQRALEALV